jgi:hypothetical protein
MATLQLGGGQTEQVPEEVLNAARTMLQQYGAGDDSAALAAFLRSAKDPQYRQQVPQLASSGKLPTGVAAAINVSFGGAPPGEQSGLGPQKPPSLLTSGLAGMASGYGGAPGGGLPGMPQNPLDMLQRR